MRILMTGSTLAFMPYVLTVDQRGSQRERDLVDEALDQVQTLVPKPVLSFERTAGDEFQGLLDDAAAVLDAVLMLVRRGAWSIGVGIGPVEEPLPASTRAARGPAFVRARAALDEAKQRPDHVAVIGGARPAADADAVLTLLAAVSARRSAAGWEAIALVEQGYTLAEAAERLGVSRQAVGQRLTVALWHQEQQVRPVLVRLLADADTG